MPITGKMLFLKNLLNSIFEKQLNILRERLKKIFEAFLSKISSFEIESGVDR